MSLLLTDTPSLANQTAQLLEEKGEKALGEDWVMEGHDLGMDAMVEQMAAAAGERSLNQGKWGSGKKINFKNIPWLQGAS